MVAIRYVDNGIVRLEVEERGRGEPVVLVHGGLADRDQVFEQEGCLATRWRLVSYSARGQGGSTRDVADHSLDAYVQDLAVVAGSLTATPLVVGGGSMGAGVSLAFAIRYPERTKAVVQVAPAYGPDGVAPAVRDVGGPASHIVSTGGFTALRDAIAALATDEAEGLLAEVDRWEGMFTPESFVRRSQALLSWQPARNLDRLDRPVLVVAWPGDDQHPLAFAREYERVLPRCKLVEVSSPIGGKTANDEICSAIDDFLVRLG